MSFIDPNTGRITDHPVASEKKKRKKLKAPVDVVRALWERMEDRDWEGARATLADDVVVLWPATRERFEGADAFIAMNRAYPEGWHISVKAVRAEGNDVLAWVEVPMGDQMTWCAQRATVQKGRITSAIDLWTDEGGAAAPTWRTPFTTNNPAPTASNEDS
ncbi:hypothetical protein BH10ACT1_BH10ACT1_25140 [soil metagenome]